jgi:phospholipase D1/2
MPLMTRIHAVLTSSDHSKFQVLALPHNVEFAPNEPVVREWSRDVSSFAVVTRTSLPGHPHREKWQQVGQRYKQRFHVGYGESVEPEYPTAPHGTCRVQVVRSVSDWSHGVLTEKSIQNACQSTTFSFIRGLLWKDSCTLCFLDIQLINEANHYIYIGQLLLSRIFPYVHVLISARSHSENQFL